MVISLTKFIVVNIILSMIYINVLLDGFAREPEIPLLLLLLPELSFPIESRSRPCISANEPPLPIPIKPWP